MTEIIKTLGLAHLGLGRERVAATGQFLDRHDSLQVRSAPESYALTFRRTGEKGTVIALASGSAVAKGPGGRPLPGDSRGPERVPGF